VPKLVARLAVCLSRVPTGGISAAFPCPGPGTRRGFAVRPMLSAIRRRCSLGNLWPWPRNCRASVRWTGHRCGGIPVDRAGVAQYAWAWARMFALPRRGPDSYRPSRYIGYIGGHETKQRQAARRDPVAHSRLSLAYASRIERSALIARAVWFFTAPRLIPMIEAICASVISP
jgi:hypothetical protein